MGLHKPTIRLLLLGRKLIGRFRRATAPFFAFGRLYLGVLGHLNKACRGFRGWLGRLRGLGRHSGSPLLIILCLIGSYLVSVILSILLRKI